MNNALNDSPTANILPYHSLNNLSNTFMEQPIEQTVASPLLSRLSGRARAVPSLPRCGSVMAPCWLRRGSFVTTWFRHSPVAALSWFRRGPIVVPSRSHPRCVPVAAPARSRHGPITVPSLPRGSSAAVPLRPRRVSVAAPSRPHRGPIADPSRPRHFEPDSLTGVVAHRTVANISTCIGGPDDDPFDLSGVRWRAR